MAVPFRKTSKSVKRIRRGVKGLVAPAIAKDPQTGEYHLSHTVDENGVYNGEQIIVVKEKKAKDNK